MKMILVSGVLFLIYFVSTARSNFPVDTEQIGHARETSDKYLLPDTIVPNSYIVTLEPKFAESKIEGTVVIDVKVVKATKTIILHRNNISFEKENVKVTQDADSSGGSTRIDFEVVSVEDSGTDTHFCTITMKDELQIDLKTTITIEYTGKFGSKNKGFYLAEYTETDEQGKEIKRVFATTQFESTSAREAFPCFDQPNLKALFTIEIIRPKDYSAISNMPIKTAGQTIENRDVVKDIFAETTVRMPTYLVAFVVSQLKGTEGNDKYTVYGVPNLIEHGRGDYAVKNGEAVIEKMAEFLDIPYSLDKLDQVAIPDDFFAAGAMENWGLVTYKQKYLLENSDLTTAGERQNVLSIIAHEFAHQWFGNLVTPKWWDCVWLSEGFATYFEHYVTDLVDSSMKMMDQFLTLTNQVAFESDGMESTRAMQEDVGSPEDISNFFDRIAYQKSGAVIRMMEHMLTSDIFKSGLNKYLTESRSTGIVEPENLWTGLQAAVDTLSNDDKKAILLDEKTVSDIMETWNKQKGYPVINVIRSDNIINLTQTRFLYSNKEEDTKWTIPITYATSKDDFKYTKTRFWLDEKEAKIELTDEEAKSDLIIFNNQQVGFYRVNYDEETWNTIIDTLNSDNFENIHVLNRAQLIDDAFNLARAGKLSYEVPLRLAAYLSRETDYVVLNTFLKSVQFLEKYLVTSESYAHFKIYVTGALQKAYETLKTNDTDDHIEKLNRAQVISWLTRYEHEDCTASMHNTLSTLSQEEDESKIESVKPDLQTAVYCGGMRTDEETEKKLNYLLALHASENVEYLEKARVVSGMACTSNTEWKTKILNICTGIEQLEGMTISNADKLTFFQSLYTSSHDSLDLVLSFIVDNFDKVKEAFEDNTDNLKSIISGIASRTALKEHSDKLATIVEKDDEKLKETIEKAVNTIIANVEFKDNQLEDLHTWLDDMYGGSSGFVSVSVGLVITMLVILNVF